MRSKSTWIVTLLCLAALVLVVHAAGPWKPLFNGQDLDGWEHVGPGKFTVENGLLKTTGGMGLLWYTKQKFGDAVLRVVYKTSHPDDNSGIFIRIADRPKDEWWAVHHGYEVQILDSPSGNLPRDPFHTTGAIYSLSKSSAQAANPTGEWNTMEISLEGPKTVVTLNGKKVNEYSEGQAVPPRERSYEPERGPRPDSGYIGVQNHHPGAEVYFREISVKLHANK
jgi:hypothetical protein